MKLIKAKEKEYLIKFDINTLIDFQELSGVDLMDTTSQKAMTLKDIRTLFHYALCNGDKNYPKDDFKKSGEILNDFCESNDGMESLTALMTEELGALLGKQKSKEHLQALTK